MRAAMYGTAIHLLLVLVLNAVSIRVLHGAGRSLTRRLAAAIVRTVGDDLEARGLMGSRGRGEPRAASPVDL